MRRKANRERLALMTTKTTHFCGKLEGPRRISVRPLVTEPLEDSMSTQYIPSENKAAAATARYRARHPEKIAAASAAYRAANREKILEKKKAYWISHREERLAYARAYRLAHPEVRKAYSTTERELAASRERRHLRRTRQASVPSERVDVSVLLERDRGLCGICGKKVKRGDVSLDHILPVSRGGPHTYANVRVAHLRCNMLRGNRGAAQLRLLS